MKQTAEEQLNYWKQAYDFWDQFVCPLIGGVPFKMVFEGDKLKSQTGSRISVLKLQKWGKRDIVLTGGRYVQDYIDHFLLKNAPIQNPPLVKPRKPSGYDEWLENLLNLKPELTSLVETKLLPIANVEGARKVGERYWFEYHCEESDKSSDAKLWYHSHQQCVVMGMVENDGVHIYSFGERCELGHPICYYVRFDDNFEYVVTEDELLDSKDSFQCDEPPLPPEQRR